MDPVQNEFRNAYKMTLY